MDLFKLVAKLGMDSSEYERGIRKAKGSFSELGSSISAKAVAMGNMIASAMEKAVNVAVDLGKSAIQNAADVTAEKAQFQATFGLMQGEAEKAFAAIEKETGIFGTRLQKVGTKAFSQFAGAGIKGADGLAAMEEYTKLAADAAAYYDITLEDADERLRSFLRGNTEAGDAIGLFTSESQRNSAAMEKYGQKWTNLTEAQKQMLMLDIAKDIYEQSGAIGQAARESDAWTNVIGNLKEAWRQATALFGAPIMAVITPILQEASEWLNDPDVQLKIEQFGLGVADAINWVLDPEIPAWEKVKTASQATLDGINKGLETAINWTLGELGMPSAGEIVDKVEAWWEQDTLYDKLKRVAKWAIGDALPPALDQTKKAFWKFWTDLALPGIEEIAKFTLGELLFPAVKDVYDSFADWWNTYVAAPISEAAGWDLRLPKMPDVDDMVKAIGNWWASVKASVGSLVLHVKTSTSKNWLTPEAGGSGLTQEEADRLFLGLPLEEPTGSAGGLYYARNNFITRLHEGEAVLTQREANAWRADQGGGTYELIAEIRELRNALMSRREVMTPDGRVIGEISYEETSRRMAGDMHSRRYAAAW